MEFPNLENPNHLSYRSSRGETNGDEEGAPIDFQWSTDLISSLNQSINNKQQLWGTHCANSPYLGIMISQNDMCLHQSNELTLFDYDDDDDDDDDDDNDDDDDDDDDNECFYKHVLSSSYSVINKSLVSWRTFTLTFILSLQPSSST